MAFDVRIYRQTFQNLNLGSYRDYKIPTVLLHVFKSIPSTNQKLWELIDNKKAIPLAAVALQQTEGKGQWGKQWLSPLGGMYLSVAISLDLTLDRSFCLVMATACGIVAALRRYQIPVLIKWSNDLILLGRKLGGIKIETRASRQRITKAVVGVGINWQNPVPEVGINLSAYQKQISFLEELTAIATYGIVSGYRDYLRDGIETLIVKYQNLLINLGQQIAVKGKKGTVTGVTPEGKLIVKLETATEVYLTPGRISLGYEF